MKIVEENFIKIYEKSFIENWDLPALSEYTTRQSLTYAELAQSIALCHMLFKSIGLKQGDKVAICGKDSISWVVTYMAVVTYGAVIVPILPEFNPLDITHIINHSEAELLFISESIWEHIDPSSLLKVRGVMSLDNRTLLFESQGMEISREQRRLRRSFITKAPDS